MEAIQIEKQSSPAPSQKSQKIYPANEQQIEIKQQPNEHSIRLDFVDVCLDVNTKQGKKRILNGVTGYVNPGEILYIMGPSGGGKTTLLDYLCNRTMKSPEGNVYLNQKAWTEKEFKKVARYCKQHPQLYEVLTVEETLGFAASFFCKDQKDKEERVTRVINLLGLQQQRTTKIGGLFYRGISGGQKQRVSVGEQLVANPQLLFLDEPTSGLDSASAFKLMESLRDICHKTNLTIVTSIHQPSQRVFDMSDRLIVLAGGKNFGGNTAYFGKTKNVEAHFHQIGIENTTASSMSEWVLDEVNGDFGNPENIKAIIDGYKTSAQFEEVKKEMPLLQKRDNIDEYKFGGVITKTNFIQDMAYLIKRGIQNNLKNPLAVLIRVITYCMMAFVLGTVWWQAGDEPKAGDVNNISGVLLFASSFFCIMSISLLPINIEDKQIMIKERSNGCYGLASYAIAQLIVSTPFTFITTLCSGAVVFFLVGFSNDDGHFILFIMNMFVSMLCSESLVLLVAYIYSHLLICIVLVSQVMGTFMVLCGFFIKKSDIPDGWVWLYHFNFFTYSFQNFMIEVFRDTTIGADMSTVPPSPVDYSGNLILEDLDMEDAKYGTNLIIILAFMFGFRLMALAYSHFKHTGKK